MKTKLLFLTLIISQFVNAQNISFTPEEALWDRIPPAAKILTIHLTSITLDAIGDAWIAQDRNRTAAHCFTATSLGLEMIGPFLIEPNMDNWWVYLSSYIFIRASLFDIVYNKTRGLPWNARHDASYWDLAVNQLNPPAGAEAFSRGIIFTIGIWIPISELRK